MQSTTNAFQDGITTDLHPLNMPETALTSALNATVFTGNGNEGLLQNDMGNTLIKDSITGSIMALNDGFIPLGMKEHGGILYIASYNPATKEGELGSIPSPIIRYTINGFTSDNGRSSVLISDLGKAEDTTEKPFIYTKSTSNEEITPRLYTNTLLILNDYIFHCGDKFVLQLDLNLQENPSITIRHQNNTNVSGDVPTIEYPQITKYINHDDGSYEILKGWFRIELYAVLESGAEVQLTDLETPQYYYTTSSGAVKSASDYWFLLSDAVDGSFDPIATRTADMYRTYPNIPAGRLAIKIIPEYPSQLEYLYNFSYDAGLPQVYAYLEDSTSENEEQIMHKYVIVPGYTFSADCPIMPDMIEVICNNGEIPVYTGENSSLGIPENCILVKSVLSDSEIQTNIDTIIENKEVPYSNRSSRCAAAKLAYKSYDPDTNTYIISKYLQPGEGNVSYNVNVNPIKNYSLQDHTGLFWIELPYWNTDIEFTLKLYTKGFTEYEGSEQETKNTYILYATQTFPKFNPAEAEIKNRSSLLQGNSVNQYYKFGHYDNDTFDLPLFSKDADQRCFLYGDDENNSLYDYDYELEQYVQYKNPDEQPVSLNVIKTICKKIYPQQVREVNSDNHDKEDGTRFIWNQIPLGYRNMPSKEFFNEIKKLGTWGKSHYASNIDWEWFVETVETPKITIQRSGSTQTESRNCLLPIRRNASTDNTLETYCNAILTAAKQQRNYFKNKKDTNGFTIDTLKKYCLYKTNLDISKSDTIKWNDFVAPGVQPGHKEPNIGAQTAPGAESYFSRDGDFLLCHNQSSDTYNIIRDTLEQRQGIENGLCLNSFCDNITKQEGGRNRAYKSGVEDECTQSTVNGSPKNFPAFYWYCPTVDSVGIKANITETNVWDYSNFMSKTAREYSLSAMGKRSIHDSYYAHLVLGFKPFPKSYWNDDQRETTLSKLNSRNTLDTEITYPYYRQKGSDYDAEKTDNFAWYVSGFITEAMKKCPGYVPADNTKHTVLNLTVLDTSYPTSYLYNKKTTLDIINFGYGLATPKVPLSKTCMQGVKADSSGAWDNDNIISTPPYEGVVSQTLFTKKSDFKFTNKNDGYLLGDLNKFFVTGIQGNKDDENMTGAIEQLQIQDTDYKLPITLEVTVTPDPENNTYTNNALPETKSVIAYTFSKDKSGNMTQGVVGTQWRKFINYKKQWELLLRDNCSVIISPQLAIHKTDDLKRTYRSDYTIKPILQLDNYEVGVWQNEHDQNKEAVWKSINIDIANLLSLPQNSTLQKYTPEQLSRSNSFQNEQLYWKCDDFRNGQNFVTNDSLEAGWYVLCINYNCDSAPTFSVEIKTQNQNTSVTGTFVSGYRFLPVYIAGGKQSITLTANGITNNTYIKNFGLYKINVPETQVSEVVSPNYDLFEAINGENSTLRELQTTTCVDAGMYGTDTNSQLLYNSIVFPCKLCFKETVYKQTKVLGTGSVIDLSEPGVQVTNTITNSRMSAQRNSVLATQYTFRSPGCLNQTYAGFQELPNSACEECVAVYGLQTNELDCKLYWTNPRFNEESIERLFDIENNPIAVRELNPIENN